MYTRAGEGGGLIFCDGTGTGMEASTDGRCDLGFSTWIDSDFGSDDGGESASGRKNERRALGSREQRRQEGLAPNLHQVLVMLTKHKARPKTQANTRALPDTPTTYPPVDVPALQANEPYLPPPSLRTPPYLHP